MTDRNMREIFMINLRTNLNRSRKTQIEAAKAIDVSQQTFNTWYNGIAIPRPDKMERLAKFFGIETSELLKEPKFDNKFKNLKRNDGYTSFTYRTDEGEEFLIKIVDKGKEDQTIPTVKGFIGEFTEEKTIPIKNAIETAKNAINPQKTADNAENHKLTADEKHIIKLYRAGKYKEIVSLMMEKMP